MPATTKKSTKKSAKKSASKKKPIVKKGEPALPHKTPKQKQRAADILAALYDRYPKAKCALDYTNPLELLVATILSAQATDVGVNKATPKLFRKFTSAKHYASSTPEEIETYINSIGLYRNKAKALHATGVMLCDNFGGEVPSTMHDLLTLRGVARKTANVVLGNAFGINEGVVVDTHVARVSHRFGLTEHTDPAKIELDLMALFPREHWTMLSHMLIEHGRKICKARGALCAEDPICQQFCANAKAMEKAAASKKKSKEQKNA